MFWGRCCAAGEEHLKPYSHTSKQLSNEAPAKKVRAATTRKCCGKPAGLAASAPAAVHMKEYAAALRTCTAICNHARNGTFMNCREAIRVMRRQPPSGQPAYHIFNLGFSAWGRKLSATACTHKSTKTALLALTEALADDLKAASQSGIRVSPMLAFPFQFPVRSACMLFSSTSRGLRCQISCAGMWPSDPAAV